MFFIENPLISIDFGLPPKIPENSIKLNFIGFRSKIDLFPKGWRKVEIGAPFFMIWNEILKHLAEYDLLLRLGDG